MAASDVDLPANWYGGFYELTMCLGPRDDARLERALAVTWAAAGVVGCLTCDEAGEHRPVPCTAEALTESGHLRGVVCLPLGGDVVCGVVAVRENADEDWLDFYLPLGALAELDPRVGGFPFGVDGGELSRAWREPIDTWLTRIGSTVHDTVGYRYAVIGFEASGPVGSASPAPGVRRKTRRGWQVAEPFYEMAQREFGFLVDEFRYRESNGPVETLTYGSADGRSSVTVASLRGLRDMPEISIFLDREIDTARPTISNLKISMWRLGSALHRRSSATAGR